MILSLSVIGGILGFLSVVLGYFVRLHRISPKAAALLIGITSVITLESVLAIFREDWLVVSCASLFLGAAFAFGVFAGTRRSTDPYPGGSENERNTHTSFSKLP